MSDYKRRVEDRALISYKTVAIGAVGLILSLVAHIHITGMSSFGADIKEIKRDTSVLPVLVLRLDMHDKQIEGVEADLSEVKKKLSLLEMEVFKQISTVKE